MRGRDKRRQRQAQAWGQSPDRSYTSEEMTAIDKMAHGLYGEGAWPLDDVTWNDLELAALYQRTNAAQTAVGDAALYHALRCPATSAEGLALRRALLTLWRERRDLQLDAACALSRVPRLAGADLVGLFAASLTQAWRVPVCAGRATPSSRPICTQKIPAM